MEDILALLTHSWHVVMMQSCCYSFEETQEVTGHQVLGENIGK